MSVMYSARLTTEAERIPDHVSVDMSGSMLTLTAWYGIRQD